MKTVLRDSWLVVIYVKLVAFGGKRAMTHVQLLVQLHLNKTLARETAKAHL